MVVSAQPNGDLKATNDHKGTERYDTLGRVLCHATAKTTGQPCTMAAVIGHRVCRIHGAGSPQARNKARLRLLELADPAIATLAQEMRDADTSADRQRAANSILDRAGFGRVTHMETVDARDLLVARILELREQMLADDDA